MKPNINSFIAGSILLITCLTACTGRADVAEAPDKIRIADAGSGITDTNSDILTKASANKGRLNDSVTLFLSQLTDSFYRTNGLGNIWSRSKNWLPVADSLIDFINHSEQFGLFPAQYHLNALRTVRKITDADTTGSTDVRAWSEADILLTDACLHLLNDLHYGRMRHSVIHEPHPSKKHYLIGLLTRIVNEGRLSPIIAEAEPALPAYRALRSAIPDFVDSMDRKRYTYVRYPYKKGDVDDSLAFIQTLRQRLFESSCIDLNKQLPDSTGLSDAVKCYQRLKKLKPTGTVDAALIRNMNTTDMERFRRLAITLDRYKELGKKLPQQYIWVNLPAFRLQVYENDSLALESRIICGKPETRTPLLQSELTDMVIYPTWTVPNSIIVKQYLPKLKNNPNYLARLGLQLYGSNGKPINPATVNWSKYSKGIPYKIMQNSGDRNALGIMKFNFNNEYAVYLHDTNQRYLFKRTSRALSHGCVRVEKWDSLAHYIARNDSMSLKDGDTLRYTVDSLQTWLAKKQYRKVEISNRIPLFINYFSCEARAGKVIFHEDIYGDDRQLREKYHAE